MNSKIYVIFMGFLMMVGLYGCSSTNKQEPSVSMVKNEVCVKGAPCEYDVTYGFEIYHMNGHLVWKDKISSYDKRVVKKLNENESLFMENNFSFDKKNSVIMFGKKEVTDVNPSGLKTPYVQELMRMIVVDPEDVETEKELFGDFFGKKYHYKIRLKRL